MICPRCRITVEAEAGLCKRCGGQVQQDRSPFGLAVVVGSPQPGSQVRSKRSGDIHGLQGAVRWALVLPSAVVAYVGVVVLAWLGGILVSLLGGGSLLALISSDHAQIYSWIVGSAAGAYYFVMAGAKTAPAYKLFTGVLLAVLQALYVGAVTMLGLGTRFDMKSIAVFGTQLPTWVMWLLLGALSISASLLACRRLYEEHRRELWPNSLPPLPEAS